MECHMAVLKEVVRYLQWFIKLRKLYIVFHKHGEILCSIQQWNLVTTFNEETKTGFSWKDI